MRFLILLLLTLGGLAHAQTAPAGPMPAAGAAHAPDSALVVVSREAPARLLAVGERRWSLVAAPGPARIWLPAGAHVLVLVEDEREWNTRRLERAITLAPGDTVAVRFGPFPTRYRLDSWPTGAALALVAPGGAETPLGTAPVVLDRAAPLEGTLVARLDGFAETRLPVPAPHDPRATLVLRPLGGARAETRLVLPTARRDARRRAIDLGLGAAAIGATALAIHWKFRADALDTAYRDPLSPQRGDEALRREAMRYDLYSGAALGAGSAALGGLALRLVLR